MVAIGGGPTGVEFFGELYDLIKDELRSWHHELADKLQFTLVEAFPNVLPVFGRRESILYTESAFKEQNIEVLPKAMVKEVQENTVVFKDDRASSRRLRLDCWRRPRGTLVDR